MIVVGVLSNAAESSSDAIRRLAHELVLRGAVTQAYGDTVIAREQSSPTGLPLAAGAIAVPHADGDHVLTPAIAIMLADPPVAFRQMGSPDVTLAVRAVFLLAFKSRDDAQSALVSLVGALQSAPDAAALSALIAKFIQKGSIA